MPGQSFEDMWDQGRDELIQIAAERLPDILDFQDFPVKCPANIAMLKGEVILSGKQLITAYIVANYELSFKEWSSHPEKHPKVTYELSGFIRLAPTFFGCGLLGVSRNMLQLYHRLSTLQGSTDPVLLQGETGTGKELVARSLHKQSISSGRQDVFNAINLATIPEQTAESELFGHEAREFTGVPKQKKGLVESSNGGTLFLDEINSAPWSIQTKLLRFLNDGVFRRLGGTKDLKSDCYLITASNQDLQSLITEGKFREDFYWRIAQHEIYLNPLRLHFCDIPLLLWHWYKDNDPTSQISWGVLIDMIYSRWQGNVRGLHQFFNTLLLDAKYPRGPLYTDVVLPRDAPSPDKHFLPPYDQLIHVSEWMALRARHINVQDLLNVNISKLLNDVRNCFGNTKSPEGAILDEQTYRWTIIHFPPQPTTKSEHHELPPDPLVHLRKYAGDGSMSLEDVMRDYISLIVNVLHGQGRNKKDSANILGIGTDTLSRKMKEIGITNPWRRESKHNNPR